MTNYDNYSEIVHEIFEGARHRISDILPSEWVEKNRVMSKDNSRLPGMFDYKNSPYSREIIDCLSPTHPAKVISVMKGAQIGFALDIETPIPTPSGFKKMKDIKVGDKVFNEKGQPVKVIKATDVMFNHKCYDVHFTDGSVIKCDAEHLWTVKDLKGIERVLNTEFISKRVKRVPKNGTDKPYNKLRNRYSIDNSEPVQYTEKKLPIDPYLLGLWLGDGGCNSNTITCDKNDLLFYTKELKRRGIKTKYKKYKDYDHVFRLMIIDEFNTWKGGFNLYGNKHIPDIYFKSSIEQRLSLLQGLIDTDGHIMKDGKVEFYNTDKKLIDQVKQLVASLGYKVTVRERDNTGKLTTMHPTKRYKMKNIFVLNFMGKKEVPVSLIPRKANRLRHNETIRQEINKRWICDVVECDSVPVKCIAVDSERNLFLAGESYIPTHNSTGVIEGGVGWIISENPGNILYLVGHEDLMKDSTKKIDNMIDACEIRHLIKSSSKRARNVKSGDTDNFKEFPNGSLRIGISNHKSLRNFSVKYGFIDDFEGMKGSTKEAGATTKMIEQRFASFGDSMKLFYISTPELAETSNIEPQYLMGDQRKFHIPCPCCSEMIRIEWSIPSENNPKTNCGIIFDLNGSELIEGSVRYKCYKCEGEFDDSNKMDWLNKGTYIPTAKPKRPGYYSYHVPALIAPTFMYGWDHYVRDYLEACPPNQPRDESKYKAFVNLCLGETYSEQTETVDANKLQENIINYDVGVVPNKLSQELNNGRIVLITCGVDLNGKDDTHPNHDEDDARLDYEIVAYSESGATYSIDHGSIGTFKPGQTLAQKRRTDRVKWTYKFGVENSVWPEFDKIIKQRLKTDDGKYLPIAFTGLDSGIHTEYAYQFAQNRQSVIPLKGKDETKYVALFADKKTFKNSVEKPGKLYLVETNYTKDRLARKMALKWDAESSEAQPDGYLNFPIPSGGKYLLKNYFSHFEAEEKKMDDKGNFIWRKRPGNPQNHLYDCRLYADVAKDIFVEKILKASKITDVSWYNFVKMMRSIMDD